MLKLRACLFLFRSHHITLYSSCALSSQTIHTQTSCISWTVTCQPHNISFSFSSAEQLFLYNGKQSWQPMPCCEPKTLQLQLGQISQKKNSRNIEPSSEIQVQNGTHTPAMVQFPYIKLTPHKSHTTLKERAGGERKLDQSCAHNLWASGMAFAKMFTVRSEENSQETKCNVEHVTVHEMHDVCVIDPMFRVSEHKLMAWNGVALVQVTCSTLHLSLDCFLLNEL